jgi:hypothetical protein
MKGKQVMLARGMEFDVSQEDHLGIFLAVKLRPQDIFRAFAISAVEFLPRPDDSRVRPL